ncbi:DUF3164 family protein [Pararhodobacter sp.]|uniref:DUF3164 family protein n=1 Tax=Pararhodobacter sp. TaxID=2127056 RepID=UPI002AFE919C|nr:DUF3164 family protein [Pararhodobacter sp.]
MSNEAEAVAPMADAPHPIVVMEGNKYMRDAKGAFTPLENVRAQDLLRDEMVREIVAESRELHAALASFKERSLSRIIAYQDLLSQHYGAKSGGPKGNVSYSTYDGTEKVAIKIGYMIEYGPELQVAKEIVDECMRRWGAESNANLRAIVNRAFQVDQQGKISQANLYSLLSLEIDDPDWNRAMQAIRDSIRVIGTKRYLELRERVSPEDEGVAILLNLAKV